MTITELANLDLLAGFLTSLDAESAQKVCAAFCALDEDAQRLAYFAAGRALRDAGLADPWQQAAGAVYPLAAAHGAYLPSAAISAALALAAPGISDEHRRILLAPVAAGGFRGGSGFEALNAAELVDEGEAAMNYATRRARDAEILDRLRARMQHEQRGPSRAIVRFVDRMLTRRRGPFCWQWGFTGLQGAPKEPFSMWRAGRSLCEASGRTDIAWRLACSVAGRSVPLTPWLPRQWADQPEPKEPRS